MNIIQKKLTKRQAKQQDIKLSLGKRRLRMIKKGPIITQKQIDEWREQDEIKKGNYKL